MSAVFFLHSKSTSTVVNLCRHLFWIIIDLVHFILSWCHVLHVLSVHVLLDVSAVAHYLIMCLRTSQLLLIISNPDFWSISAVAHYIQSRLLEHLSCCSLHRSHVSGHLSTASPDVQSRILGRVSYCSLDIGHLF
jgi:hypothetical protein